MPLGGKKPQTWSYLQLGEVEQCVLVSRRCILFIGPKTSYLLVQGCFCWLVENGHSQLLIYMLASTQPEEKRNKNSKSFASSFLFFALVFWNITEYFLLVSED